MGKTQYRPAAQVACPELFARDLVYDWNRSDAVEGPQMRRAILFDESLRDGLQGPSVVDPTVDEKLELVRLMESMGIQWTVVGMPGAGARATRHAARLTRAIVDEGLRISPAAAARTHVRDIRPIVDITQETGRPVQVMAFLGASPIRQLAESWSLERLVDLTVTAIRFAVGEGLPVCFVTEDTTRSRPETLDTLFRAAMDAGATGLCLCDTVGHATPDGVRTLVSFARSVIESTGNATRVHVDWHGHNDRGLALANTLAAYDAGADRLHGTGLGIGERVGNTSMDQLMINLRSIGAIDGDLGALEAYRSAISRATRMPIPHQYPRAAVQAHRQGADSGQSVARAL